MVTPEEARRIADAAGKAFLKVPENALCDLANQVERLEAQRKQLREALVDCAEALQHIEDRMGMRVNPPTLENARAALKDTE